MQIEGTKLIFVMNFSALHFFKFASRMPRITQTFKIFRRGGHAPDSPRNFLPFFFPLAIPGSAFFSSKSSHNSDLKISAPVATHKVSAGTSRPGVRTK